MNVVACSKQRENSQTVVGRPFPPGVSGNPGGRPRGLVATIRAETEDGAEMVAFMLRVLRDQEADVRLRDRVAAATWLADRCFGKPPQALAVNLAAPDSERDAENAVTWRRTFELLPPEVVRAVWEAMRAARDEAGGQPREIP
jgi:hypothetical protein